MGKNLSICFDHTRPQGFRLFDMREDSEKYPGIVDWILKYYWLSHFCIIITFFSLVSPFQVKIKIAHGAIVDYICKQNFIKASQIFEKRFGVTYWIY